MPIVTNMAVFATEIFSLRVFLPPPQPEKGQARRNTPQPISIDKT